MHAVTMQRERSSVDRLDRSKSVALDAGDLHETADRIAGHAEMMRHTDFGSILDLRIRAAKNGRKTCRSHRAGTANLALAADFSTRDGRVHREQRADGGCGQQEAAFTVDVGSGAMVAI